MHKVAVIILNWNGEKLLEQYLPSVIQHTDSKLARIIVADNASSDNSVELVKTKFPIVDIISLDRNYGFAGGYNKAIGQTPEEIVVLLNSDVEVTPFWLEPLVKCLESLKTIVAVQPKIKSLRNKECFEYAGAAGGYIDKLGFPFCRGRIIDTVETDIGQYDDEVNVFWCSGAALTIKRSHYINIGGLDENFFAHMEEIDLCWRLQNQGASLKICPSSVVYHYGGASLPMNHPHKLYLNYRNNLLMMYKNLSRKEWKGIYLTRLIIDTASALFFLLKGEFKKTKAVFRAYKDFYKLKTLYSHNINKSNITNTYRGSILFQYFIKKRIKYSQLRKIHI